jgi:hypothetical protein
LEPGARSQESGGKRKKEEGRRKKEGARISVFTNMRCSPLTQRKYILIFGTYQALARI